MSRTVTTHEVERHDVVLPSGFDEAVATFERLVPPVDLPALEAAGTWDEAAALTASASYGFLVYWRVDVGAAMSGSAFTGRAVAYLVGNHVTAERMARHDPQVMLHAPLRMLIHDDAEGAAHLVVDRPSSYFGSYGDPAIAEVGGELDGAVERLLEALKA
ncbi:DUF302 domain-containing protein [Actinomycetospora sp. NBRC 106378]|uniref:DUF302 domain-containing protein n=1 Tax=Actinomycetospora sp. NBRC 106378 TaxID=3032208 RepID=UPI0024A461DF|nr:DUF302 domain-containing protein [Actinomycetospora sp. NBRC 106378]GLZ50399.1 hypothetical protein Acsp07_00160 [Actinomycetospora sp. NBRC 106378]